MQQNAQMHRNAKCAADMETTLAEVRDELAEVSMNNSSLTAQLREARTTGVIMVSGRIPSSFYFTSPVSTFVLFATMAAGSIVVWGQFFLSNYCASSAMAALLTTEQRHTMRARTLLCLVPLFFCYGATFLMLSQTTQASRGLWKDDKGVSTFQRSRVG